MNYRYRLIFASVVILSILYALYPVQATIVLIIATIAVLIIKQIPSNNVIRLQSTETITRNVFARKKALSTAQPYLMPYKSIWGNLCLKNKYVKINLNNDGTEITANDISSQKLLTVIYSSHYSIETLWNLICGDFNRSTTFESFIVFLTNLSVVFRAETNEKQDFYSVSENQEKQDDINQNIEKIDINNASEKEISTLPGVSIILAKRIVKKRNEIGGFKNIEEFLSFTKLNNHVQEQIKPLIKIQGIEQNKSTMNSEERSIDL